MDRAERQQIILVCLLTLGVGYFVWSGIAGFVGVKGLRDETAKLAVITALTLTPISRAASGFWTTASIALPRRVRCDTRLSATANPRPTRGMRIWRG